MDGLMEMGGRPNSQAQAEVAHSRIIGDYYRDLSTNYYDYDSGSKPWPDVPAGHVPAEY
jgi:hypothetical protein